VKESQSDYTWRPSPEEKSTQKAIDSIQHALEEEEEEEWAMH
jgi:hypothetical protein